ncbi:zeta toxin family protein [Actinotignum sp. GS-2025c]|uniref:zeta toxin family protein n=1 Tax=unclassified Actinotignum TaxID=2632702 RepID=UPI003F453D72
MSDFDIREEWLASVKPSVFAKAQASLAPVSIFVGGQPGAGKTKAQTAVLARYAEESITQIIGDDLRAFHPDYEWLINNDPLRMPEVTAPASGQWIAMCMQWAIENSFSTLVEGTWRNTAMVIEEADKARKAGRRTHAVVVAVPPLLSQAGLLERFYFDRLEGRAARWTPPKAHEVAVEALEQTVTVICASDSPFERFTVMNRDGDYLYDEAPSEDGVGVFRAAFHRTLTDTEKTQLALKLPLLDQGVERFTPGDLEVAVLMDGIRTAVSNVDQRAVCDTKEDIQHAIRKRTRERRSDTGPEKSLDKGSPGLSR